MSAIAFASVVRTALTIVVTTDPLCVAFFIAVEMTGFSANTWRVVFFIAVGVVVRAAGGGAVVSSIADIMTINKSAFQVASVSFSVALVMAGYAADCGIVVF